MKYSALFALASFLGASALPTGLTAKRENDGAAAPPAGAPTDTQVLQYALTLEHLENKFYADALAQFSEEDFEAAGLPNWVRGRLSQVASHENSHVVLLAGALGDAAVQPCNYKFSLTTPASPPPRLQTLSFVMRTTDPSPYTDVASFISLAHLIENVGVSAYLGAAQYISDPTYLTVAGSILTVEARHQTWQSSAVLQQQPWQGPFDTPLGLDMVYTIAAGFIDSCPDSNAALPVKAFPALTVTGNPGDNVQFTFDDPHSGTNYAVFYSGLGTSVVQLDENDYATIPENLQGIFYVVVSTSGNATEVSPDNIVAGPAILESTFDAWAENPTFSG